MRTEACVTQIPVWFHLFIYFFYIVLCFLVSVTAKGRCRSTNGGRIAEDENKDLQALRIRMELWRRSPCSVLFCFVLNATLDAEPFAAMHPY